MRRPVGFTLVELLVVISIFGLALGFVFYDFRVADKRASLRQTVQQVVERLQEMRTWSVANRQPSTYFYRGNGPFATRVTAYGARFNKADPDKPVQYAWKQDNSEPNYLWDAPAMVALIEPQLLFTSSLKPWDTDIRIKEFRFFYDDTVHILIPAYTETAVGFLIPNSTPITREGANNSHYEGLYDLFVYFENSRFPGRCWELIIHSAGDISAKEASC